MSEIYSDISSVCIIHHMTAASITQDDINWYISQGNEATDFAGRAAALMSNQPGMIPHPADIRIKQLLLQNGWVIFAICVCSKMFRRACLEADQVTWDVLLHYIWKNCYSIEGFAKSRNLPWRAPLLGFADYNLPGLQAVLGPDCQPFDEPPHHCAGTGSDASAYPIFEEHTIKGYHNYSLFDPTKWPRDRVDPACRKRSDGSCILCMQHHCSCKLAPLAGSLVELVQCPNKEPGIRSLSNLKKGDILDLFAMEYCPFVDRGDQNRPALTIGGTHWNSNPLALVLGRRYRKWHKLLNTSCNASTEWREVVVGNSKRMVIQVTRDISFGELITIPEK